MNAASDLSMLPAKQIVTIKDSVSFTLNETELTEKKAGESLVTPKRDVPSSDLLQWWVRWYPVGRQDDDKGYVSVYFCVNKPVKTKFTFAFSDPSLSRTFKHEFTRSPDNWGRRKFACHDPLRTLFSDGKLTVTCNVEFEVMLPVPRNCQLFHHVPTDVEFVIGSERVPAHKNFLTLISPVLQAMFTHDTAEAKSGIIDITEFDFDTVKAAVDFCYGREVAMSVATAVGILRFCDKYFITPVVNELEKLPLLNPSVETFCAIVRYAYDCNKDKLLTTCYDFFKNHQNKIKATEEFAKLPMALIITVIKSAFELKTDYEVLYHAGRNGIDFVVNHLEEATIGLITLDNFCTAVTYAWNCSREKLQQTCAQFLNENRDEVMNLEAFNNLPSDVFGNVFKSAYVLKRRQEVS